MPSLHGRITRMLSLNSNYQTIITNEIVLFMSTDYCLLKVNSIMNFNTKLIFEVIRPANLLKLQITGGIVFVYGLK